MRGLIDTQAVIWMLESDPQLSVKASLAIKNIQAELQRIHINILPVEIPHLKTLSALAYHHKDPFDRLLISQAITENLTMISSDQKFPSYPVKLLW